MNAPDEKMDNIFRDTLSDYDLKPPQKVWDRIEHDLNQKKKRNPFLYFRIAASILLFSGITTLVWKLNTGNPDETTPTNTSVPISVNTNKSAIPMVKTSSENNFSKIDSPDIVSKDKKHKKTDLSAFLNIPVNDTIDNDQSLSLYLEPTSEKDANPVQNQENSFPDQYLSDPDDSTALSVTPGTDSNSGQTRPVFIKEPDLYAETSDDEISKQKNNRFLIGAQAGPQYTYRYITAAEESDQSISEMNEYETPVMAYAGGVNLQMEATRRIVIQSGVYYSKFGTEKSSVLAETRPGSTFTNDPTYVDEILVDVVSNSRIEIVNSAGTMAFEDPRYNMLNGNPDNVYYMQDRTNEGYKEGKITSRQYFEFVEIPLFFRYTIIDRKMDLQFITGISTNILVNDEVSVTDNVNFSVRATTSDIKTINYSGSLGVGIDYPLSKKLNVSLEPYFKYYLSSMNKDVNSNENAGIGYHPYMLGIMTGLSYSF